ncbi:hypothetical protein CVT26_015969 [Gymnopilus dilepis]|uniref:Uncharacterized protein n=1 Tax=Gymnopilus dilepis TaxID=231916 RepID=A0A409XYN9_9AGAR|nr:hypothetical protein CVT26_015969 [Gymnopilus dilepis]
MSLLSQPASQSRRQSLPPPVQYVYGSATSSSLRFLSSRRKISAKALRLLAIVYQVFVKFHTLGFHHGLAARLSYRASTHSATLSVREHDQVLQNLAGHRQWDDVLKRMKPAWKAVCAMCALLLSVSVAFLQIGNISENGGLARTAIILASVFATAGLITGTMYVGMGAQIDNSIIRTRWIQASINPRSIDSADFWANLALPISSAVWSLILCIPTWIHFTWTNKGDNIVDNAQTTSGTLVTIVIFCQIFQVYRVSSFLWSSWRQSDSFERCCHPGRTFL